MADTLLVLGSVVFQGFEIPSKINFGGKHQLQIHDLVGGSRVVDAMGARPAPIKWEGRFRGSDALERALLLDQMRQAGAQIFLSYFSTFVNVVITEFEPDLEQFYEIPYKITVEAVDSQSSGAGGFAGSLDSLVASDLLTASDLAVSGPAGALDPVTAIETNVALIPQLQGAPLFDLNGLSATILTSGLELQSQADAFDATIFATPFMVSGGFAPDLAVALSAQSDALNNESETRDIKCYVDRIGLNVAGASY